MSTVTHPQPRSSQPLALEGALASGSEGEPKESTICHEKSILSAKTDSDTQFNLTDQTNLLPFKTVVIVFMGLALCMVVSTLDSVIVATALPTITSAFNAGSIVSWVPSAYFLTSTSCQPLYGRLSDIFGRKSALCFAMTAFMVGSLASGFSNNIVQLIVFRGLAGAGGGAIVPMVQIIMSDIVSLRDRGKYQGIIGGVVTIGYVIGPLLGGVLSQKVSWRWAFWISLPLALAAICVVIFILPLKPVEGAMRQKLSAIDYPGAALTLIGCTLIMLPLIWGGVTFSWSSPIVLATLISGILVIALFCIWEWKGARLPIVPMHIFKHITVVGVYIAMFINGFVFHSSIYYLPQFFQVGLGFSPTRSGVFLLPLPVGQTVASFVSGIVVSKTGHYRALVYIGFALWAIGCGCISAVTPSTNEGLLVFLMLLSGVGAGMTSQTTTVAAQASVSRSDMSVVTAVRNFVRLFGATLSIAITSAVINNSLRSSMVSLSLPTSTIYTLVNNPGLLGIPNSSALAKIDVSPTQASFILAEGYNRGFKLVFILYTTLLCAATLTSTLMIKHKDLLRGDEQRLKDEAERKNLEEKCFGEVGENILDGRDDTSKINASGEHKSLPPKLSVNLPLDHGDLEKGVVHQMSPLPQ